MRYVPSCARNKNPGAGDDGTGIADLGFEGGLCGYVVARHVGGPTVGLFANRGELM